MITQVMNLRTGSVYSYTLPPKKAVVAAFEQYEKKNFNIWNYDFVTHSELVETDDGFKCGNFFARKV